MFKVGDIVRPIKMFSAHRYLFKIHKILRDLDNNISGYKLQRIEQKIDPTYGPIDEQLRVISFVEKEIWHENELNIAGPTPDYPQEIKNENLLDLKEKCFKGITIQGDSCQDTTVKLSAKAIEWMKSDEVFIPTSLTYEPYSPQCELKTTKIKIDKINKEEKEMDILKLYEGRKGEEIAKNYRKERERILKEDEIQSIIIEMQNQVNTILENQNLRNKLEVDVEGLYTAETEKKLEELRKSTDAEREKLRSTLDEIRALFEMTDNYEERIKILKNYGIVGDNGRINA